MPAGDALLPVIRRSGPAPETASAEMRGGPEIRAPDRLVRGRILRTAHAPRAARYGCFRHPARGVCAAVMAIVLMVLSLPGEAAAATKLSDQCKLIQGLFQIDSQVSRATEITRQAGHHLAQDVERLVVLFASEQVRQTMSPSDRERYSATLLRLRNTLPGSGGGDQAIPTAILRLSAPQKQALHDDYLACGGPEAEVVTSTGREPLHEVNTPPTADEAESQAGTSRRSEQMSDDSGGAQGVATAAGVDHTFSVVMLVVLALLGLAGFKASRDGRADVRVACLIPAKVKTGPASHNADILNISLGGCKLHHYMPDVVQGRCVLEFGGLIREGRIVWSNQHYAGVTFQRSLSRSDLSELLGGKYNHI